MLFLRLGLLGSPGCSGHPLLLLFPQLSPCNPAHLLARASRTPIDVRHSSSAASPLFRATRHQFRYRHRHRVHVLSSAPASSSSTKNASTSPSPPVVRGWPPSPVFLLVPPILPNINRFSPHAHHDRHSSFALTSASNPCRRTKVAPPRDDRGRRASLSEKRTGFLAQTRQRPLVAPSARNCRSTMPKSTTSFLFLISTSGSPLPYQGHVHHARARHGSPVSPADSVSFSAGSPNLAFRLLPRKSGSWPTKS